MYFVCAFDKKKTRLHATLSDKTRLHAFMHVTATSSALHCNGLWLLNRALNKVYSSYSSYGGVWHCCTDYIRTYVRTACHHPVRNLNDYQNGYEYQCQLHGVDQLY